MELLQKWYWKIGICKERENFLNILVNVTIFLTKLYLLPQKTLFDNLIRCVERFQRSYQ